MGFVGGSNDGKPEKPVAQCSRVCSELYRAVGMTIIADGVGRDFTQSCSQVLVSESPGAMWEQGLWQRHALVRLLLLASWCASQGWL